MPPSPICANTATIPRDLERDAVDQVLPFPPPYPVVADWPITPLLLRIPTPSIHPLWPPATRLPPYPAPSPLLRTSRLHPSCLPGAFTPRIHPASPCTPHPWPAACAAACADACTRLSPCALAQHPSTPYCPGSSSFAHAGITQHPPVARACWHGPAQAGTMLLQRRPILLVWLHLACQHSHCHHCSCVPWPHAGSLQSPPAPAVPSPCPSVASCTLCSTRTSGAVRRHLAANQTHRLSPATGAWLSRLMLLLQLCA